MGWKSLSVQRWCVGPRQSTLMPGEFAKRSGWKNDSEKVRLMGK